MAAPVGDIFRTEEGNPEIRVASPRELTIHYARPGPGIDRLFDSVAMVPASVGKLPASADPWFVEEYPLGSTSRWFNESPAAMPGRKKKWFTLAAFRHAVSMAIGRDDIARVVYHGHAHPAVGPISPSNRFWFNAALKPLPSDEQAALRTLAAEGSTLRDGVLRDHEGHPVEFSLITNAGNRSREAMAAVIKEDLRVIGMRVNLVTLDFGSLIERITKNTQYEAGLLRLANIEIDPSARINVWLGSGDARRWPSQKTPATQWEASIDKLVLPQASEPSPELHWVIFGEFAATGGRMELFVAV